MENFVVSARKYRPATFESVVGQRHITSTLKNAIERGQLAHAYLFCGPRGVGKTTCARIFAKSINCLNPQNGSEPCGECESCKGFEGGRSMNIHELDAASNNSVEDIRSLIEQVRIIPQVGRYALFIIDEVHMLSTAAFNAFLKTLEEPPAHAIFILATTERHKILPTILSRCQCYDFNRIRVEDGAEYLRYIADKEGVTIDDESLNLIAQKADGGMRDALSMFDKAVSFGGNTLDFKIVAQTLGVVDYDTYFALTDRLLEGNYGEALVIFDSVIGSGFGVSSFLTGYARHLRDLLVAQDQTTAQLLELTGGVVARYREQATRCSIEFLFGAITILTEADNQLRRSSNQRLLVELGLMKLAGLGKKKIETTDNPLANVEFVAAKPRPRPEPAPEPTPTQVVEVEKAKPAEVVKTVEAVKLTETVKEAEGAKEEVMPEPPKATPKATPKPRKSGIINLKEALMATSKPTTERDEISVERRSDPEAERKLTEARAQIIEQIGGERPRLKPNFEAMKISGEVITVEVQSTELDVELRRSEIEILEQIVKIAGVDGSITLNVVVNEAIREKRPIKLEDRIAHFTELNPTILALTEALDLQVDS